MTAQTLPARQPAATWFDGRRYLFLVALAIPSLPYIGYALVSKTGMDVWWFVGPIAVFGLVPVLDRVVGEDGGNPPADLVQALNKDRYYRWMTFAYLPLQFGSLVLGCWVWVRGDISVLGRIGLVLTISIVSGIGINTAHELGHKLESAEKWLSKIALAPSFYGHFFVEHNYGHHTKVATPEDPASARLGESLYRFLPRTLWFSLLSAIRFEWRRFRIRKQNPWTWRNHLLSAWGLSVALWAALTAVFGWTVLPFLVLQAALAMALLETVNYLEHYGLLRQRNEAGRYEKVDPRHSWNSDRLATNMFLYQLQRHSDHHANPTRRYQALRTLDVSPQLPSGYAAMVTLSWFPPIWFRMMDHRVVEHYGGDVRLAHVLPAKREKFLRRYPTPAQ